MLHILCTFYCVFTILYLYTSACHGSRFPGDRKKLSSVLSPSGSAGTGIPHPPRPMPRQTTSRADVWAWPKTHWKSYKRKQLDSTQPGLRLLREPGSSRNGCCNSTYSVELAHVLCIRRCICICICICMRMYDCVCTCVYRNRHVYVYFRVYMYRCVF